MSKINSYILPVGTEAATFGTAAQHLDYTVVADIVDIDIVACSKSNCFPCFHAATFSRCRFSTFPFVLN